jgi:DNA gyrase subunit A
MEQIAYFNRILNELDLRMQIIKDELIEVRDKFGDERRTLIDFA